MHNSIYLQVEGVTGEALDAGHQGWIDVLTFEWHIKQPTENTVGGGGGCGRLVVKDLLVYARLDKAMPTMMTMAAEGRALGEVVLSMDKAGGKQNEFLNISLKNVIISAIELAPGQRAQGVATDGQIGVLYRFSPSKLEVKYSAQSEAGQSSAPVTFTWDVKSNTQ